MKLMSDDSADGPARPDQLRMSRSVYVYQYRRSSRLRSVLLVLIAVVIVVIALGGLLRQDSFSSFLWGDTGSAVPSVLAMIPSAATGTPSPSTTVGPAAAVAPSGTPTVTVPAPAESPTTAGVTPAAGAEASPAATSSASTASTVGEVTATSSPTVAPSPTATPAPLSPAEAATATADAPRIGAAVAATLTALPTPDQAATATSEAQKIAAAVAATLTALPGQVTATLTVTLTSSPAALAETPTVAATLTPAGCTDGLRFVADVTIPDNTQVAPGEAFTKTWQVENNGTCPWQDGYKLIFSSRDQMSAIKEQVVTDTLPGGTLSLSVPMTAPAKPGKYTGIWQVVNATGAPVGDVLTVVIDVPGAPGTPGAAAPAAAGAVVPASGPPNVNFGYGIQAHMWDADMGQVVSSIQNMGFNWVKQQTPWKVMEPEKGNYQWGSTDRIVDALTANGLKPMFSVVKSPDWARPSTTDKSVEGPPADPQDFANFLGAMAARYKGRVKAYEIWNEQNLHYEWGNEPLDPARYMQLLKLAYSAIKAADPGAVVISGALTPTGAPQPWAIDDYTYLEAMYQNGLKDASDAVGAHPSGYNVPPEADWQTFQRDGLFFTGPVNNRHHSWSFRATMEGYRNIALKYGDQAKSIWPTEFGWATSPTPVKNYEYAADNSLQQQADYTVKAYQMGKDWGWVGPMFLWNLNFRAIAPGSEMAQWGIVDQNWGALPAYAALAAMPK